MFNKRKSNIATLFKSCYHDNISNIDQVYDLMRKHGDEDGLYLVRNSFSEPGRLVLTIKHNSGHVHIKINHSRNNYTIGASSFTNMDSLLEHFTLNAIENEEKLMGVILRSPIAKEDQIKSASILRNHDNRNHSNQSSHTLDINNGYLPIMSSKLFENNPQDNSKRTAYLTPSTAVNDSTFRELPPPPTVPSEDRYTTSPAIKRYPLSSGWYMLTQKGQPMKFMSPSGETLENLPTEVLVKLSDDEKDMMHSLMMNCKSDNHLYMDMRKTSRK